jgi:hypothetical protein
MKTYLTHKSIFEKVIDFMARTIPYKEYEPKTEYKSKLKYKPAVFPAPLKKIEFDNEAYLKRIANNSKKRICPTYNIEYDKKHMTRWKFHNVYKCFPEHYPF